MLIGALPTGFKRSTWAELITPDRANERVAQLCYLPNRGEFYKSANNRKGKLFDPLQQWLPLPAKRDTVPAEAARLEAEKQAAKSREALKSSDAPDTIGVFNQALTCRKSCCKRVTTSAEVLLDIHVQTAVVIRQRQGRTRSFIIYK